MNFFLLIVKMQAGHHTIEVVALCNEIDRVYMGSSKLRKTRHINRMEKKRRQDNGQTRKYINNLLL